MKNSLYHYGVKGMKWGVWNENTRRQYSSNGKTGRNKMTKTIENYLNASDRYADFEERVVGELMDKYGRETIEKLRDPDSYSFSSLVKKHPDYKKYFDALDNSEIRLDELNRERAERYGTPEFFDEPWRALLYYKDN